MVLGLLLGAAPAGAQVVDDDPGAASRGAGDLHVFTRGADGGLWTAPWTGSSWSPWGPLGGELSSGVSAAGRAGRILDVVVRGPGNAVYHRRLDGTTWSPWELLGGEAASKPAVTPRRGTPNVDVAITGGNGQVYHQSWDGTHWAGWSSLGGTAHGGPALVSYQPGWLHAFYRGPDDAMYAKWWNGSSWSSDWISHGGQLASAPVAVSQDANLIDVFARFRDGAIYQLSWFGSNWTPWRRIEGVVTSGPAAAVEGVGKITLFARRGADVVANVYDHGRGPENGWSGWQVVRPPASEGPPAPPPQASLCGGTEGPTIALTRRPRRAVPFGSRPAISGRVRSADGSPVADAEVRLLAVGQDIRDLVRVRTSGRGGFRVRVPGGPSRVLQLGVAASTPAGALRCTKRFQIRVRAGVTLRLTRVVHGRRIPFRGRVRGGPIPRRGLLVQLEAFDAGRWRQFKLVRTDRRGRFAASWLLQRTTAPRSFRFRARVRVQPPFPYTLGSSRPARVRVVP